MTDRDAGSRAVAAFELVPGHPATEAEVSLWSGALPGAAGACGTWVVLRGDDWPMSADVARRLAAALLEAADRAEAADDGARTRAETSRDGTGVAE